MPKHARKPNYKNIALAGAVVLLIILIIVLLVSMTGKKEPEPAVGSVEPSFSSGYESSGPVSSSEEKSSSAEESSSEESSSASSSSSRSESSSSSSSGGASSGGTTTIPETPYSYDTTGKTVRNVFDENGEVDILFPINVKYYITRNFKTAKLVEVEDGYKMDYRAAPHCKEMLEALRRDIKGTSIVVYSTIRTFSYQEGLFQRRMNKYINKGYSKTDAYNAAATSVAIPGTSEHQLGFAIDVYLNSLYNKYGELNEHFEETEEYRWLQEHACEYGFILSYPKDKIKDTGIIYEPWHYRYVGVENAKKIKDSGMLLVQWIESQNIAYVYNGD